MASVEVLTEPATCADCGKALSPGTTVRRYGSRVYCQFHPRQSGGGGRPAAARSAAQVRPAAAPTPEPTPGESRVVLELIRLNHHLERIADALEALAATKLGMD